MDCPACSTPLVAIDCDLVEVDYCVDWQGIWLDAGELALLFEDVAACDAYLSLGSPADAKGEVSRKCPICGKRMTKEQTSDGAVLLDYCPANHGLWFDRGELEQV